MKQKGKKLKFAESFYVEARAGKDSNEQIAAALGIKVEDVAKYLESLHADPATAVANKFLDQNGSISMTQEQSELGDQHAKKQVAKPPNKDVFIMDPKKPTR